MPGPGKSPILSSSALIIIQKIFEYLASRNLLTDLVPYDLTG